MNEHALDLYVEKTNEKIDVSGFTQLYSKSPQRGDSARRSEMLVGPFKLQSWDQIQLSSESLVLKLS